jgi:hypothetical protein
MAGVIRIIAFPHNAKHAAESIDHEVIRVIPPYEFEQALAGPAQRSVLRLFERRYVTLSSMEYNSCRINAQPGWPGVDTFPREGQIGPWLGTRHKLGLDLESIAVQLKTIIRFHQPDTPGQRLRFWGSAGRNCDMRLGGWRVPPNRLN